MAIKILKQDTTDLATGADWWTASNNPTFGTNTYATTTTDVFSDTFTAPSTSDSCVGILVYITGVSSPTSQLTFTLQEGGVNTACAVTTPLLSTANNSGWSFFLFPTPYTYTTTSTNAYRFRITRVGTSTALRTSATGTSTIFAYAVDDRSGIASNDKIFIVGDQTSSKTVTIASSFTFGNGVTSGSANSDLTTSNGIQIGRRGRLVFDDSTDITLTCSATLSNGTGGSLIIDSSTNNHTVIMNQSATGQMKFHSVAQATQLIIRGQDKVGYGTYSSGVGTAADPLIISSARPDWVVGDEIVFYAVSDNSTNYNEVEKRFIITKNSNTSFVLSNTSDGSENALTFSHTDGDIINLNRSCLITTNDPSFGVSASLNHSTATSNSVSNVRFLYPTSLTIICGGSNVVSDRPLVGGIATTNANKRTYSYMYVYDIQSAGSSHAFYVQNSRNVTIEDLFVVKSAAYLLSFSFAFGCILRRLKLNSSASSSGYGFRIISSSSNTITEMEMNCIRAVCNLFSSGTDNSIFKSSFGKKGSYGGTLFITASDLVTVLIADSVSLNWSIGATTTLPDGSTLKIQNEELTTNKDYWYTNFHTFTRTGTGLADTTTRLGSGFALRYEQRTASQEGAYTFEIPVMGAANKAMAASVWVKINSANFYSDTYTLPTLRLTYDGATISETVAIATTAWQKITVAITPTVNDQLIKANLYMETDQTGSGSYVYIEDISAFYPPDSVQNFGSLNSWADGMPLTPPISLAVSAQDVWAIPNTTTFGVNTMGEQAVKTKRDTQTIKSLVA